MSQKAIDDIIAPRDESGTMVMDWLESAGLGGNATYSARGDSVIIETNIAQAEKLLDAEYSTYRNTETNEMVLRTLEFSLPIALKNHIQMVQPTTFFGLRSYKSNISGMRPLNQPTTNVHIQSTDAVKGCSYTTNPTCLANLYSFKSAKKYTTGLLGIAGFLEEYAATSDLETFLSKHGVNGSHKSHSFDCVEVNGGSCPTGASHAGGEASLDVQYARGIAGSVPITYYSTAGRGHWVGDPDHKNTNEPFLEFLEYLLGLDCESLPNTLSISYGDVQQTVPDSYATHVCDLFSQLGARGVSVLVASGDSGVGGPGTCTNDDGVKQFATLFPASCPVSSSPLRSSSFHIEKHLSNLELFFMLLHTQHSFMTNLSMQQWVTAVGGTAGTGPEGAWSQSGGGFSSIFPQPSYQAAAVKSWLDSGTADSMLPYFNASGRAYPDVAARAVSFAVVLGGLSVLIDGTSAAAPTFASIIQLVNSDRIAKDKAGLGFLNPWLYANATSALTDIKKGEIIGCPDQISKAGFKAVSGWDPTTGLGTPVFTSLLALSNKT